MSDEEERKKPGPKPSRLVIEGDPEEALDRLVGKQPAAKTHHDWRRLDQYDKVTSQGMSPGVLYRCKSCGHYARSDSVPGPCPPPDGSPKILDV